MMATRRPQSGYQSAPTPAEILPAESVEDPELRFLLDHWTRLKGDRARPTRSEISPKDLRRSLRYVHLYDVVEGGFRARLVGTDVFPGLDEDQTGRLVSEHPDPGVRLRFTMLLDFVARTGAPARSVSRRVTASALTDLHTEGLWLPLGDDASVTHILAQSSFKTVGVE